MSKKQYVRITQGHDAFYNFENEICVSVLLPHKECW